MKKKDYLIVVFRILIVVIVTLFWGYKLFLLIKYRSINYDINKNEIFNETLTISKNNDISSDVIKFGKLTINNYFHGYEKSNSNVNVNVKYDENKEVVSFFSITSSKQYINVLSMNSFTLYSTNDSEDKNYNTEDNMIKLLFKNNINNDVDLYKFIKENYYLKNNLFTCRKKMRNNYLLNSFVEALLTNSYKMVLIKGDLNGYIICFRNNIKEIHLLNGDEQYIISLSGLEIVDEEFIEKLLSSASFD